MIAIIANAPDRPVVAEFFELFKTPWEFYRDGRKYDIILRAGDGPCDERGAKLVLTYSGRRLPHDGRAIPLIAKPGQSACILSCGGSRIPIYGDCVTFARNSAEFLVDLETGEAGAYLEIGDVGMRARIGYDLFREVRALLSSGQPVELANSPALELHISLLRDLILASGVPLVEVPPVPDGHRFIACLTHDVDHPSVRLHKFDHTMFGFLYRAVFGSLLDAVRGRTPLPHLLRNWAAALKLPLVHLGLVNDFWSRFQDYPKIEKGLPSSFYIIPFKGRPGRNVQGPAPTSRASAYGAANIAPQIQGLMAAGCEVGLHGIDAWRDSSAGQEELDEIRRITRRTELGVRMHWLYFDDLSARILERAGATYDSTVGYNDAVGYRAGTTQAYKPLPATRLLELPLHLMDTALFYPRRMNLSPAGAKKQVDDLIDQAGHFGGTITINWHDRSIAPERNWGEFYEGLIHQLKQQEAWFATASQAVAWFRKRRSVTFDSTHWEAGTLHVKVTVHLADDLPALRLRIHKPRSTDDATTAGSTACQADIDLRLLNSIDTKIALDPLPKGSVTQDASANDSVTTYAI